MSNKHYDEFCKATIPNLTLLDRALLGHYSQRFNEQKNPPHAWPPLSELLRITGAHEKSISRSLGRLTKRNLLIRVTVASKDRGLRAEYALNLILINSFIQVTDELPDKKQVTEQTQEGNPSVPISNPSVLEAEPYSYPKRIKPIKHKNVSIDAVRFYEVILKGIPKERRDEVTSGGNYEALLNELEALGLSRQAIRDHLNVTLWSSAKSVGAVVELRLKELVAERARVLALREQEAEIERLRQLEESKRLAEVATYDGVTKLANEVREAMKRNRLNRK